MREQHPGEKFIFLLEMQIGEMHNELASFRNFHRNHFCIRRNKSPQPSLEIPIRKNILVSCENNCLPSVGRSVPPNSYIMSVNRTI